ncbi:serine threonine protein kinase : Serine/threonine protein kinase (Fragment) OS=Rhodopirellula maiorica SM1 GN=RMSM_05438 PE=3 SV=1: Pkinase [Gemmata massiliana]|uniref:Protein kinase domain-containing protein n=1 Tax=Gemmata massiliana TaxID=1210884 RepID=A0A6P2D0F9_9BACT
MPSDSIASFFNDAKANRVLFPDQVEQIIRQPDAPQTDLTALCSYLLEKGVLTQYQADAIREGRGQDLSFANYPVVDKIGPCPGGTAYRALHPSLRTPVVLRRLNTSAFGNSSNSGVINRARTFGMLPHANLLPLLDAGEYRGEAYAVLDQPTDSTDLGSLLIEIGGAMPGFLAAEYGWAIASALRTIHDRGGWHGEVRPGLIIVGPLTTKAYPDGTTKRRPAHNAIVKLAETGLIPAHALTAQNSRTPDVLAYLSPESVDSNSYDARGDIYGLGASLYLMLAGRAPHTANTPNELATKIHSAEAVPLSKLRPDLPPDLAALVMRMIAKRPEDRPQTAQEVQDVLAPFCRAGTLPPPPAVPMAVPISSVTTVPVIRDTALPVAVPVAPPEPDGWGVNPDAFADATSETDAKPTRRKGLSKKDKNRSKLLIVIGLCMHLTAFGLLVAWLGGYINFDSSPAPTEKKEPEKEKTKTKQPREKPQS